MVNADRRVALLQAVEAEIRKHPVSLDGVTGDQFKAFAGSFLRRAEGRQSGNQTATDIVAEVKDLLQWAATRGQDDLLVRVFNPSRESHGYELGHTVIQTCMADQPFILDTLRLMLRERDLREYYCHHPIVDSNRAANGKLTRITVAGDGALKESWIHFEIEHLEADQLADVERDVRERLTLARFATVDFKRQLRRVTAVNNELLLFGTEQTGRAALAEEISAFMSWLMKDNFIFLGYAEHVVGGSEPTNTLGICRPECKALGNFAAIPSSMEEWLTDHASLLFVGKGDYTARVHRAGRMDTVLIRRLGEDGLTATIHMFCGLLTHKAVSEDGASIPILRGRLQAILRREEAVEGSHEWKAIISAFNSLPVEYLLGSGETTVLHEAVKVILSTEVEAETRVFLQLDPSGLEAFLLVSMPREVYDADLLHTISSHLESALGATYHDVRQVFGEHDNVVVTVYATSATALKTVDVSSLEAEIVALTRTWDDRLSESLRELVGDERHDTLIRRYVGHLPRAYQLATSPAEGAQDLLALERLFSSDSTQLRVSRDGETGDVCRVKLYQHENVYLTDSLPVLANFGLRVIEQTNTRVVLGDGTTAYVDTFRVVTEGQVDLMARATDLELGVRAVLVGHMENDLLNRLLLQAALSWRQVDMLRAYVNCARQIESHFPLEFTRRVWVTHNQAARLLTDFIVARFDPDLEIPAGTTREELVGQRHEAFNSYLRGVENAAEDRILRTLGNLVESSLRTNFYMVPTRPYISFKLDSSSVTHMPSPRPFREIFVHHPKVEGMHLRGGPIARGGLRWSDRFDDYRTEVLGLMRTQMVKNVVIVPQGSKGGFVLKERYSREEERQKADELYKIFIAGLLDITDNNVGGQVVPPQRVIRYDQNDPYLVVAADKGTAHLSDTANGISLSRGFWLGDAFASGGSQGYDHKKEAITAKGAWECVKRHFNEMGLDPERDVITVAGIGDMAGDVFGNGMLLSKTMKVQAVFNHMHIFFDPDPDPAASWVERHRLFHLPRSSWEDYNKDLISAGGGIYRRSAKAIPISEQMKKVLGVEADSLSGEETVQAILKMKCDLLWNGGIGTYVKASTETHRDANDRVNDPVRVDANQLRCKVVAEGGNLGFTILGRAEFSRLGGRCNTDALDNSAGVDMSDHEVNLKLLLGPVVESGRMTTDERNIFLRTLTDEVSELVLNDNFSQSRCVSLDSIRSKRDLTRFSYLMEALETRGLMKREMERMPTDSMLATRQDNGEGLLRPELCVLLAFTKMQIKGFLRDDQRLGGEIIRKYLLQYFPRAVREQYQDDINKHPLRQYILATALTSRIVDLAGMTFFQDIWEDTSFTVAEAAMAYLITSELLDSDRLHNSLRNLEGKVSSAAIYRAHLEIEDTVAILVRRVLRRGFPVFEPDTVVGRYRSDFQQLRALMMEVLPAATRAGVQSVEADYVAAGFPAELARDVATFPHLLTSADIAILAEESGLDLTSSARLYHGVGEEVNIRALVAMASPANAQDRWEKTAIGVLRGKLIDTHYAIAHNVAARRGDKSVDEAMSSWMSTHKASITRTRGMEKRIVESKARGAAPLFVLAEVVGELAR